MRFYDPDKHIIEIEVVNMAYEPNLDELMFFDEKPGALELYENLAGKLFAQFPDIGMRVQKTQIVRIDIATEPYPGRWTHHILIEHPEEIDDELMDWFRKAYHFARIK